MPGMTVGGDTMVTVAGDTVMMPGEPSLERSFSPAVVGPGGLVVVTITAMNYGGFGQVVETLPEGFEYVSTSLSDTAVETSADGRTITFTLIGDETFTYTVMASDANGQYSFSGVLMDSQGGSHTVESVNPVTVGAVASRSLSADPVYVGGSLMVTITATNYGGFGQVEEMLPAGFMYVSTSLSDTAVEQDDQDITFTLLGDESFTYNVTASSTPGTYMFGGNLSDSQGMSSPIEVTSVVVRTRPIATPVIEPTKRRRRGGGGGGGSGGYAPPIATPTPMPTRAPVATIAPTPTPIIVPTIVAPTVAPTPEPTAKPEPTAVPPTAVPTPRPTAIVMVPTVAPTKPPEPTASAKPTEVPPTAVPPTEVPPTAVPPTEPPAPTATIAPTVAPVPPVTPDEGGMPTWLIILIIVIIVAVVIAAVGFYMMRMRR